MDEIDYNAEFAAILGKAPAQPPSSRLNHDTASSITRRV